MTRPPLLIPISCNLLLLIKVDVADLGLACGSSRNQTNAGKLLVTCERECPDMNSDRLISQEDRICRLSSNLTSDANLGDKRRLFRVVALLLDS